MPDIQANLQRKVYKEKVDAVLKKYARGKKHKKAYDVKEKKKKANGKQDNISAKDKVATSWQGGTVEAVPRKSPKPACDMQKVYDLANN